MHLNRLKFQNFFYISDELDELGASLSIKVASHFDNFRNLPGFLLPLCDIIYVLLFFLMVQ